MEKGKLEDVIRQMNEKAEQVFGKLTACDCHLDVIYNGDGSFKALRLLMRLPSTEPQKVRLPLLR